MSNFTLRDTFNGRNISNHIVDLLKSGETQITIHVGPRHVAAGYVSDIRRWWHQESGVSGADSEAVHDYGRTEMQGWSDSTPDIHSVDWRVIMLATPSA